MAVCSTCLCLSGCAYETFKARNMACASNSVEPADIIVGCMQPHYRAVHELCSGSGRTRV
eukprot:1148168-Pelagomonas_calceolata.AAC.4